MENKSLDTLGRLLAVENLKIERRKAKTAHFELVTRTLVLPIWEKLEPAQETLLVAHEVGHALFTTTKYFDFISESKLLGFSHYMNIVEDARVERLMKEKYPGLRRDFFVGYNIFNEIDFFGIKDKNINSLTFIDRINLHFKLGSRLSINFSDQENTLVSLVEEACTEEDVQCAAIKIYEYSKAKAEKKPKKENEKEKQSTFPEESEEDSEDELESSGGDSEEENDCESDGNEKKSEDSKNDFENPHTQDNFNSATSDLIKDELSSGLIPIIEVKLSTTTQFIKNSTVLEDLSQEIEEALSISNTYNDFKLANDKIVYHMVKEFEMRKSAERFYKSKTSKSGTLDTAKLVKYKIAQDIFKTFKIKADSTSHGMIMLLDYSGSMVDNMRSTLAQVITLVKFCKFVDIKFDVLAFSDGNNFVGKELNKKFDDYYIGSTQTVSLIQFYTDSMGMKSIDALSNLLYTKSCKLKTRGYSLNFTPLVEALLYLDDYISKFKLEKNVQKISVVTLTDGGATRSSILGEYSHRLINFKLYSRKTNRYYDVKNWRKIACENRPLVLSSFISKILKDNHPDVTFLGFYLVTKISSKISSAIEIIDNQNLYSQYRLETTQQKTREFIKKLAICGSYSMIVPGYDKFFMIDAKTDQDDLLITPGLTARQLSSIMTANMFETKSARNLATEVIKAIS